MRKIIAGINMTLDGNCDHRAGIPDEEMHQHYTDLLNTADAVLYGRITYDLMKFWQTLLNKPSGKKTMDDFAVAIDKIPKIVFSQSLQNKGSKALEWDSAKLSDQPVQQKVSELKQQAGRDLLVGSRSLIMQLLNQNLIDEFQLCIQPVLAGKGLPLFEKINERINLKLLKTKTFGSGAIVFYYQPAKT